MKKTTLGTGLLLLCALFSQHAVAQKTRNATSRSKLEMDGAPKQNAAAPGSATFERWISKKIDTFKNNHTTARNTHSVITIPVVVHVIHDGDAVGTGENLSDAQILSQLVVLNQDFRRAADTPGFNTNPVGADVEIEFCLAQRDPNGLATTGIVRYNMGDDNGFDVSELDNNVKPNTIWDPTRYLNIWVVKDIYRQISNFQVSQSAYTTYPTASGLEGIDVNVDADKDGIVIGAKYFGTEDIFPSRDYVDGRKKGRTATHEMGHYLGLLNIWGDGDCSMDDYCADTPVSADGNIGCPTDVDSCTDNPGMDMVQNYMDTTNDECQNVFTQDQKTRMLTVLQNSPRRATLGNSDGCQMGITYDNDAAIKVENVAVNVCNNTYTIAASVVNAGYNPINTASIHYVVERVASSGNIEVLSGDYNWSGALDYKAEQLIELPYNTVATAPVGNYKVTLTLTSVNGTTDQTALNNVSVRTFSVVDPLLAVTNTIYVAVKADQWGREISWKLYDSSRSQVLLQSDTFTDGQVQVKSYNVAVNTCYIFEIKDAYGDGICCSEGAGFYAITKTNPGTPQALNAITAASIVKSGGSYGSGETVTFKIVDEEYVNTKTFDKNAVKLYPNPASSSIRLSVPATMELPDSYTIYNSLGQRIDSGRVTSNDQNFAISNYANGVYFITLTSGDNTSTLRFIKY
ncbi:M43 family zinc metalloprotease [Flavobacterium sp. RNTU_13]|uniref:M43 family zinc metalloprotease n=1 Tax=Flavobacterium sp. RNTU_13 TaxID=3375145 RepID=UPI0039866DF7